MAAPVLCYNIVLNGGLGTAAQVPVEGSAAAVGGAQDGAGIGMGSTAGTREMDGPSSDGSMARSGASMLLLLLLLALAL